MRRPNCLFSSRSIRCALQQHATTLNRASNVNFGTLGNIKIAKNPKQVNAPNYYILKKTK